MWNNREIYLKDVNMLAKNNEFSMCEIIEYSCPECQDYENEDYEKWWVFRVYAADWKELEDNLTFAEGVCYRMDDCSGIPEANPELWTNLKYIRIAYYDEDAEVYEQELKELFPDVEVHVGNR
jgi:hypothetical protein